VLEELLRRVGHAGARPDCFEKRGRIGHPSRRRIFHDDVADSEVGYRERQTGVCERCRERNVRLAIPWILIIEPRPKTRARCTIGTRTSCDLSVCQGTVDEVTTKCLI